MRVTTGIAKRKSLLKLTNLSIRPTTSRVKEAMFSIIQFDIQNKLVLDLFSGSGQLGIEALSRGALNCTFVDNSLSAHKIQMKNLKITKLEKNAKVIISDAIDFIKNTKNFYDIIILDPPYHENLLEKALMLAQFKLNNNGLIICEHLKTLDMSNIEKNAKNIRLQKQYDYGKIRLSIYNNQNIR